jgi:hypothetical protein
MQMSGRVDGNPMETVRPRFPIVFTVSMLGLGVALFGAAWYLESHHAAALQRHPIMTNLIASTVAFCFGTVVLTVMLRRIVAFASQVQSLVAMSSSEALIAIRYNMVGETDPQAWAAMLGERIADAEHWLWVLHPNSFGKKCEWENALRCIVEQSEKHPNSLKEQMAAARAAWRIQRLARREFWRYSDLNP